MATQKEEREEQKFFAEKLKEQNQMEKHPKHAAHDQPKEKTGEKIELDSLGQPNPAWAMERDNIQEAKERQEEKDKKEQDETKST